MAGQTVLIKPVSGACNMRCRYCFYADEMNRRGIGIYPPMTTAVLERIVRRVIALADGPITFAFQGGEPTLAGAGFFRELLRLEKEYNPRRLPISNSVQTNGLDLDDELIALFAENHFLLGVSLDGCEAAHDALRRDAQDHGTYQRVCATIQRLAKAQVDYNILCVVNHHVAGRTQEVLDNLQRYPYVQFIPCLNNMDGSIVPHSLSAQEWGSFLNAAFERYQKAFWKGTPWSVRSFDNILQMLLGMPPESCSQSGRCHGSLVIESNGDVYPCDFYMLDEWRLGSLMETPLRALAHSECMRCFEKRSHAVPEECSACRWYPLCRNGCYRERSTEAEPHQWCASMKLLFEKNYANMEKMAQELSRGKHTT